MAYDRLYLQNGQDNLTYYDGTDITTFTGILAPTNTLATFVKKPSTGGSASLSPSASPSNAPEYTYSYKVSAYTEVGETDPSSASVVINI